MTNVGVIGATGRIGRRVVQRLRAYGLEPIAFVRNPCADLGQPVRTRVLSIERPAEVRGMLRDLDVVVCCAPPWSLAPVLHGLTDRTARLVAIGSARKYTRFADPAADAVREAEAALARSGRSSLILHPTMTYGEDGEQNVQRLLAWMHRLPVVPLPTGRQAQVQPVYLDDVAETVVRAAILNQAVVGSLVVAGPEPMTYAVMVRAVADCFGCRVRVVRVPVPVMLAGAALSRALPGLPRIHAAEVRRLQEDKAFNITPLRQGLGLDPLPFAEGLARMRAAAG